jgi:TPR repeat protein
MEDCLSKPCRKRFEWRWIRAILIFAAATSAVDAAPKQPITELAAAAGSGDAEKQKALGDAYARGEGVAPNDAMAVVWYRKSAAQGLASAQSALAGMIFNCRGARRDYKEAAALWRESADQKDAVAEYNLGAL